MRNAPERFPGLSIIESRPVRAALLAGMLKSIPEFPRLLIFYRGIASCYESFAFCDGIPTLPTAKIHLSALDNDRKT